MNFFKLIIVLSIIFSCPFISFSQFGYYDDVTRFGQNFSLGTTRVQSLGGINTSIGGDISSILGNPAGLGFFNSNYFSMTINSSKSESSSNFNNETSTSSNNNFGLDNFGLVYSLGKNSTKNNCSDCVKFNLGVGYNKVNDFKESVYYAGYNNSNSIIDYFLNQSQGIPLSQLGSSSSLSGFEIIQEAYDHYLINPNPSLEDNYYSFVAGFPYQQETITNQGNQYKLSFSIGANYQDNVFFGVGLSFNSIFFQQNRSYIENQFEIFENEKWISENILDYLEVNDRLETIGSGISGSLGMIIKPTPSINFGISYKTKTNYKLKEESGSNLYSNYFDYYFAPEDTLLSYVESATQTISTNYNLIIPGTLSLGTTFFIDKYGFISADIDFINYSYSKINSENSFDPYLDNEAIADIYRPASNFRIGAEGRFKKVFYVRMGFQYLGNPYDKDLEYMNQLDKSSSVRSFGIGFMKNKFSIDIAYRNEKKRDRFSPYNFGGVLRPIAKTNYNKNSIIISLGFKLTNN